MEKSNQARACAYEAALDRLVDTHNISYDEARRILGDPPYEVYEVPPPEARSIGRSAVCHTPTRRSPRRSRSSGDEDRWVGYDDSQPPYHTPAQQTILSDKQAALNSYWVALIHRQCEEHTVVNE